MTHSQSSVGQDILSYCGKCKLPLAHTIVSLFKNTKPAKVQCRTCQAMHKYRDPDAAVKKKKVTKAAGTRRVTASKKSDLENLTFWEKSFHKALESSVKKYTIFESFEANDLIDHSKFGQGVVRSCLDENKIEVVFKAELKTLIHSQEK